MKKSIRSLLFIFLAFFPFASQAALEIGVGKADITPRVGTPSAGYMARAGEGMKGVHDPLLAIALYIDNGEKQIVLCSVDHLGFPYEMVQEITQLIQQRPELSQCEVYIGSSHTHSGGGSYLNISVIGEKLAGKYDPDVVRFYIQQTVEAVVQAKQNAMPCKIGIGYGQAENLSQYRARWPQNIVPENTVAVIKVTRLDGTPVAAFFNYAVHPTVLKSQNLLFSADFVSYARTHIQNLLGTAEQPIYFNGAQGDLNPVIFNEDDRYASCQQLGFSLAETVVKIWKEIETSDVLDIKTRKESYAFKPQSTPFGLGLPLESYQTEINLLIFNHLHAFVTIPGELSTIYDRQIKKDGEQLGYKQVSMLGLTNDAHGYIITPEAWRYKTEESHLSFGGEVYGEITKNRIEALLKQDAPLQK